MAIMQKNYLFGSSGRWRRFAPLMLLIPGVFLYVLIALGPSLATVGYSFTDASGLRGAPVSWIGLANYDEFLFQGLASRDNIDATLRTLRFSVLVTFIQFSLGLILALLVNQKLRGRTFYRTLFFMPVILGVAIQGLMWKLFLQPRGGPMATMFGWLGLESEFLGGQPGEAFAWVIVVQIWANVGVTMVIFLAGMQAIDTDLYEAARIDGAGGIKLFRNITWPQLTPAINTNFLLNIIGSLQAWQLFLVLIGYKPGTQVLGYVVFAEGFGQQGSAPAFRQGFAAAASIVLFLLVLVLGVLANRYVTWRERRYMG
jgi:raffinose/stachyose/melibiose transport system permease protein